MMLGLEERPVQSRSGRDRVPVPLHGALPKGAHSNVRGEKSLSDASLDALAAQIRALKPRAKLSWLRVGELLVNKVHAGDPTAFKSRKRAGPSIRELARRLGCKPTWLFYALMAYELSLRLAFVHDSEQIKMAHLRVAFRLPEPAQETFLQQTILHNWTAKQLEAAIAQAGLDRGLAANARKPIKPRKPRKPAIIKAVDQVLRAPEQAARELTAWAQYDRAAADRYEAALARLGDLLRAANLPAAGVRKATPRPRHHHADRTQRNPVSSAHTEAAVHHVQAAATRPALP